MRLLALLVMVGSVACTRMNPSYGDGGVDGPGTDRGEDDDPTDPSAPTITDASASVGEDAEASADEASSFETGFEESAGEGGATRSCCARHLEQGCEDAAIESCVCEGSPKCCEIGWSDECVEKARTFCNAECGVVDDGPLETSDTHLDEGTSASDSFGTSGTSSTTTTAVSDEGGSTGPMANACCAAQLGPGCGDDEIENCVCVLQGLESCCSDEWEAQCSLAVGRCGLACA